MELVRIRHREEDIEAQNDPNVDDTCQGGPGRYHLQRTKEFLNKMKTVWTNHRSLLIMTALIAFCFSVSIAGFVYVGLERSGGIFGIAIFSWFCLMYKFTRDNYGSVIYQATAKPLVTLIMQHWKKVKWASYAVIFVLLVLWLALDTSKDPQRFISLLGLVLFVLLSWLLSSNRTKVKWRPVLWGIALQFVFALFILRTDVGFNIFQFVGAQVEAFLLYTDAGSIFVFGEAYTMHFFAFKVLPLILFLSSIINILYYIGLMQTVIKKVSWLMQRTLGTSGAESLSAAANIFIGQTESPLLIRPFLGTMTMSELHAVMTAGFASIAGSVLGVYIIFGAPASHLLSASIMSAPAALAISKVLHPETDQPETADEDVEMPKPSERGLIEAAGNGAHLAIPLVANIAANLISFIAILALVDGVLAYFGVLLDLPDLSFKYICSYVLRPVAFIMGVAWEDTPIVAELIGVKTFLNEFVAYKQFSDYVSLRKIGGTGKFLQLRSEVITTYALCGFSNFASIGVQIGGIGALAPSRTSDLAKLGLSAMIGGTIACFMTACIAGLLY